MDVDEEAIYNESLEPAQAEAQAGPSNHGIASAPADQGEPVMSKKAMKRAARMVRDADVSTISADVRLGSKSSSQSSGRRRKLGDARSCISSRPARRRVPSRQRSRR